MLVGAATIVWRHLTYAGMAKLEDGADCMLFVAQRRPSNQELVVGAEYRFEIRPERRTIEAANREGPA